MSVRQKLRPVDYLFMIGGPVLFLLIFWLGVRAIIGPIPEPNPIQKLRDGDIKVGSRLSEVQKELGRANEVQELPDGGYRLLYTRTVYEQQTRSDSLDEATIEVSPEGFVRNIRIERVVPPPPNP